jgi:ribosomal protein L11
MSNHTPLAPTLGPLKLAEIDRFLEDFYPQSKEAAGKLSSVDLGKSQIRGFETIVTSSTRFSQIVNYIKNQAGKDNKQKWSVVAPLLLEQLDQLEKSATEMAAEEPVMVLDIKMRLVRGWAGQVVAHCLYVSSQPGRRDR